MYNDRSGPPCKRFPSKLMNIFFNLTDSNYHTVAGRNPAQRCIISMFSDKDKLIDLDIDIFKAF